MMFDNLNLLYIFSQLYLQPDAVFLGFYDAVCSMIFSNKLLRLSQYNYINTEIKLHTGWRHLLIRLFQKEVASIRVYLGVSD